MIALLDNTVFSNFTVVERAGLVKLASGCPGISRRKTRRGLGDPGPISIVSRYEAHYPRRWR
jgi:hypothetical protein